MHRSPISITLLAVAAVLLPVTAPAQTAGDVSVPRSLSVNGQELQLAACGERTALWFDVYAVALYLPPDTAVGDAMLSPDAAKAVQLHPTYGGELPDDIPSEWRERLEGTIPAEQLELLQQVFDRMTSDDVGTVTYRPGEGTALRIDDEVVGRTDDARLMHGVLEIWEDPDYPLTLDPAKC